MQSSFNADVKAEGYLLEACSYFKDTASIPERSKRLLTIYKLAKKEGKPMTKLVDEILRNELRKGGGKYVETETRQRSQ